MVIAVNTRILSGDTATGSLLAGIFTQIAAANPSHQFILIAESDFATSPANSNIKMVVIKQQSNNPLLWKLWYNYKLPAAVRKIKADVLVSADAVGSLRTRVPQILLAGDTVFLDHPEWYKKKYLRFLLSNIAGYLHKAASIITFSAHCKNELIARYPVAAGKTVSIDLFPAKKYVPRQWLEGEAVKETYTQGKEYFLFKGDIRNSSNLVNLLKAFSLFKKRQKSSMQLIIVTGSIPEKDAFIESLRLYKYRNELQLLTGLNEDAIASVIAAAYCSINLSPFFTDIHFLQHAIQYGVPVIAGNTAPAKEILGDAALYANPSSSESIAELMMLLFKDENKRNSMVKKGIELTLTCTADKTANQIWQNILAIAGQ